MTMPCSTPKADKLSSVCGRGLLFVRSPSGVLAKQVMKMVRGGKVRWRLITVLALVLVFVIVVLQNTQVVPIRLLFWTLSMSRIVLLLFALCVGGQSDTTLHGVIGVETERS